GAAAVDAPAGIAVADGQGGQGGQQGQQEEGQDEPPVQAGVLEAREDGYGRRVTGQGNGHQQAAPGSRQILDLAGDSCVHVDTTCTFSQIRCCQTTTICSSNQTNVAG